MLYTNLLRGEKVYLTALNRADMPTVTSWFQDIEFLRAFDATPAYPRGAEEMTEWLDTRSKDKNEFIFAIRRVADNELLGIVELDGILWTNQVSGLSIGIGNRAERGKGYGYEAMQLILAFAFDELNLHRITITVFSYNDRAIALYEKLGFQREGTFREFVHRDGQRYDMYLYGLLCHEYEVQQTKVDEMRSLE